MNRTLIQQYPTGIVKGLVEEVRSVSDVEHAATKGRFRELFVANILHRYLTSQYGIGSGIIINQRGDQSNETDVVIYDNRILPPFIGEERTGVFPIEAVIAAIEVKSHLTKSELLKSEQAARRLQEIAQDPAGSIYPPEERPDPPGSTVIAFYDGGVGELHEEGAGKAWLSPNMECIWAVCLVQNFSWLKLKSKEWTLQGTNEFMEETKGYIGVLLDNVRTQSERNYRFLFEQHRDWLSVYTRDNPEVKHHFALKDTT